MAESLSSRPRKASIVFLITLIAALVQVYYGEKLNLSSLLSNGWHLMAHVLVIGLGIGAYIQYRRSNSVKLLNRVGLIIAFILLISASYTLIKSMYNIILDNFKPEQDYLLALKIVLASFGVHLISILVLGKLRKSDDRNYVAIYLHVLADMITALASIIALLLGYYWAIHEADGYAGVLSSIIVLFWVIKFIRNANIELSK